MKRSSSFRTLLASEAFSASSLLLISCEEKEHDMTVSQLLLLYTALAELWLSTTASPKHHHHTS
jgi:hypothetical protein